MNQFHFLGRLTQEATIRNTNNGGVVYSNSIAVNRRFVKEGEERQADFFNITAFGKTAEFMQKYMSSKGQQILVAGRVQNRTWEDDNNVKHYATDFIVEEAYFADTKKDNTQSQNDFTNTMANAGVVVNSSDDLPF